MNTTRNLITYVQYDVKCFTDHLASTLTVTSRHVCGVLQLETLKGGVKWIPSFTRPPMPHQPAQRSIPFKGCEEQWYSSVPGVYIRFLTLSRLSLRDCEVNILERSSRLPKQR